MRVLITDASYKHTLAAVRALGRRGIYIATVSAQKYSLSFYSKYCQKRVLIPASAVPLQNTKQFILTLKKILNTDTYDVLLPIGLASCIAISQYKNVLSKYVKIPIAEYDSLSIAADKQKTIELAQKIGVPVPKTIYPEVIDDVENLSQNMTYPVVIKPVGETGSLWYANSRSELIRKYREMYKRQYKLVGAKKLPLLQEYIEGNGYGFFALFNRGKPRAIFMHKRIREYPITGGPSVVAESVYIPELKALGLKILKRLNWHGVAMVEFKQDLKDGKFKLMEINPKFWGSLELAIVSGVDFPYLACKMALDGDVEQPVFKYKTGIRFRWLFPGEVFHLIANFSPATLFKFTTDFFKRNIKYDIDLDDVTPNLLQLCGTIRNICILVKQKRLRYPHGYPAGALATGNSCSSGGSSGSNSSGVPVSSSSSR